MSIARTLFLAALAGVAAACSSGESIGGLTAEQTFNISLTPEAEIPAPKPTSASGNALVIVFPERIDYQLSATNITGITMAHIHEGAPGVAGPIVVTLFLPGSPTGNINGVFTTGSLAPGSLPGGVTLESLKALLASGNAYVNVHTTANTTGEIRGQLR